jgi:pyruvate dehydrogenase E1 component alpha subunit
MAKELAGRESHATHRESLNPEWFSNKGLGMSVKTAKPGKTDRAKAPGLDLRDRTFTVPAMQILDDEGNLLDKKLEPKISEEDLTKLYKAMVLARQVDDRLLKMQRQGRIGTFPPATGQEAAHCAPALLLRETDWFVGAFRELGARLMRGEPIENDFIFHNGFEEGNTYPGGERTLPISIIIASHMLHAVGLAYAMKMRGEKETVVLCFFGDGATSEGDFHEAMNFAACWQVPVIFVCQNNQWAISVPRRMQTHSESIAQKAVAYDMPGIQADGNDPLAMYAAAKEAFDRARSGGGPTFIEAVTYRLRMHTTADDPKKYQPDEMLQAWEKRDPLPRMRKYLTDKGIWDDAKEEALAAEVKQKIDEAVKRFEAWTDFKPEENFEHVFGTPHPRITGQKAEFVKFVKEEAAHG